MLMEAKVRGMNEYNASEGAQLMIQYETEMATTIRDDTASNDAYWDAGYRKGQEYTKGWAAAQVSRWSDAMPEGSVAANVRDRNSYRYAYGLDRVPYDDFPALLHEGERVLTAREAREADSKPGRSISITITGNQFGAGVSAEEIAQRLADQIELKFAAGVLS